MQTFNSAGAGKVVVAVHLKCVEKCSAGWQCPRSRWAVNSQSGKGILLQVCALKTAWTSRAGVSADWEEGRGGKVCNRGPWVSVTRTGWAGSVMSSLPGE